MRVRVWVRVWVRLRYRELGADVAVAHDGHAQLPALALEPERLQLLAQRERVVERVELPRVRLRARHARVPCRARAQRQHARVVWQQPLRNRLAAAIVATGGHAHHP